MKGGGSRPVAPQPPPAIALDRFISLVLNIPGRLEVQLDVFT